MVGYKLCPDISFVADNGVIIVLNFETGEYYTVEGICMKILQQIEQGNCCECKIIAFLCEEYDADVYDLNASFSQAIEALKEIGFIVETIN